ncbi:shufflon system plasmid conjugative transfer pilus tip adhesin PilV [Candidatus Pacearchaeota archaeon]|nr:shufflon system plasmid conjugative transfer pilus tip adhesin PilV [Candidatus Pacearchaeota archaeon]
MVKRVQVNLSNKLFYVFIVIGLVVLSTVAVYALTPGVAPNPGHLITQVAPPSGCSDGQVLGWSGSGWSCVDAGVGESSVWTKTGTNVYYTSGNVGIGISSPIQKLEVNGSLKLSAANPYIYSGGSYIVIPNGLYVSGGTPYFKNTIMARNGIKNDGSADNGHVRIKDSLLVDSWLRTSGKTGWYSQSYGGGWYMSDSTWIRSYGSKPVYINKHLRADGGLYSGGGADGNKVCRKDGTNCPSSGTSVWTKSGTNVYYNSGNVGIGDSTPSYKLDIAGNLRATTDIRADDDVLFYGELMPDGAICSTGQILKKSGSDNWDCANSNTVSRVYNRVYAKYNQLTTVSAICPAGKTVINCGWSHDPYSGYPNYQDGTFWYTIMMNSESLNSYTWWFLVKRDGLDKCTGEFQANYPGYYNKYYYVEAVCI